ncbi:MAG TPA: hypothetical protein VFD36_29875 [Kofleriaceae bacterium]|nr:hypothetical protein [Kofleriaceae bacterium]
MAPRHAHATALAVLVALVACERAHAAPAGKELVPSRAAALGEFRDNPLLDAVPADTVYAFASFKPVPVDVIRGLLRTFGPIWRRSFQDYMARTGDAANGRIFLDVIGALDVRRLEQSGIAVGARFVIYGVGEYPFVRIELSNGDRVFELIQTIARRIHEPIPPPIVRGNRRYWMSDAPDGTLFAAIAPRELILGMAPRAKLDANLAVLLGEQRPPRTLTTAQFRDLARRDGFTGQGVGFVDLTRIPEVAVDAVASNPACRSAFKALIQHAPRLAFGLEDVTLRRLAFGFVIELAPDALAVVRGLSTTLAGYERLVNANAAFAIALAFNLDHGRTVLSRAAAPLREFGERCGEEDLVAGAQQLAAVASKPLPSFLAGPRGGFFALTRFKLASDKRIDPSSVEGFGTLQLDRTAPLLQYAASQSGFELQPDRKVHVLPPTFQVRGHVAANDTTIAIGLGGNSAATAAQLLDAPVAPAPLILVQFDYRRAGTLIPKDAQHSDDVRAAVAALGVMAVQLLADERGLVVWSSLGLR